MRDQFVREQQIYLNSLVFGMDIRNLTREQLLSMITYALDHAPYEEEIKELIRDIYAKVENATQEQWEDLKSSLPYRMSIPDQLRIDK